MKKLYLAAAEEKAGKTSLAVGLARAFLERGGNVAWRKPVGWASTYRLGRPFDRDAEVVAAARGAGAGTRRGDPPCLASTGGGVGEDRVRVGRCGRLPDPRGTGVAGKGAPLRPVGSRHRWAPVRPHPGCRPLSRRTDRPTVDRILACVRLVRDEARLLGVVINEVSADTELDEVRGYVVPFLEERGVPVLGVIPFERRLRAVQVGTVVEELGVDVETAPISRPRPLPSPGYGFSSSRAGSGPSRPSSPAPPNVGSPWPWPLRTP